MSIDDLTRLFDDCLAREALDPAQPHLVELWAAWLAFVSSPIGDGSSGDEIVAFASEPNEPDDDDPVGDEQPGTRVYATRGWDAGGSLLQLTVIAIYDPVLVGEFDWSCTVDGRDAVLQWQRKVEASRVFSGLRSAGPARSLTTWPVYESGEIILRPGVLALELDEAFARLLRESAPDTRGPPDVVTIWRAFVALARLPVADVAEPGTDDDTVEVSAGSFQGEHGSRLVLRRCVVRRDGTAVNLTVIADLEGFEASKRVSALEAAGSDAAADAFAEAVERNPAFPLLAAATVRALAYGVDEIG